MTKALQRTLIIGWLLLALFLMSSFANAQDTDGFPTIITQQGVFTIIETGNSTHVCTRQGASVICN